MSQETRDRIRALVAQFPGLHLREVARQLDMSLALVQYHIPPLVEAGHIVTVEEKGTQRLFPAKGDFDHQHIMAVRDPKRLHLVLTLLDQGPCSHRGLTDATGMGKSTVSFHLKRLVRSGMVHKTDHDYALIDPDATRHLIAQHRPTPDIIDKFAKMWSDLYS